MDGVLMPTKWYYPTAASSPVPCEWQGWVNGQWLTATLIGEG